MVLGSEDHWHAFMHVAHYLVRGRGQDRTALDRCPVRPPPPAIPEAGERKDSAVADLKAEGLLPFDPALPFIETVRRDQAPAPLERLSERWPACRRFRSGVDRPSAVGWARCPPLDQAP